MASKAPLTDVPWARRPQGHQTTRHAIAPAAAATIERVTRGVVISPRRQATRTATPANTATSAMFCFTRSEAIVAAPASAAAAAARRSLGWSIAASTAASPPNDEWSREQLAVHRLATEHRGDAERCCREPGPRGGPSTAETASDVRRTEDDQDRGQAAQQAQRNQSTELGRDPEDGDEKRRAIHPVVAVERRTAGVPLLADHEESRLVATGVHRQERKPDQDRDQGDDEDRVPLETSRGLRQQGP